MTVKVESTVASSVAPSAAEPVAARRRSLLRRMAEAVTSPRTPEEYLDLLNPLMRTDLLRARVVEVKPETADAATVVLKPGRGWLGHVPGQYVRLGFDIDGVRHWRSYSLTSGPNRAGTIAITVKAVADGLVSPHLVHGLRPGALVLLDQAAGDFVLPEAPVKMLFVTAGSGITPVIGMLRNLYPVTDSGVVRTLASRGYDIVVIHAAPSEPETIFAENLRELDRSGAIRLIPNWTDQHGRFDVADLDLLVPDLAERVTYACGPAGLLDDLDSHHGERGLPLFTERFRLSPLVERLPEGASAETTVSFTASSMTIDAPTDRPILDAAEAAGVLMPSGCRMGICFGCVSTLTEGVVRDLRSGELTVAVPGETENGVSIQTCISAAAGPCTINR